MLITVVLGVIGGAWTSLTMLREVESINRAVRTIMEGDLSERIPITGRGGDMEVLVLNFNSLLDRIQSLMAGVRQVSDNIAHDLRTPLTRLRNHLSNLEQHCKPENREEVQAMLAEADGLLATFSGLLRIAQVESGHRRAGFGPVNLSAIVQDVVELYEPLAQDKQQQITLNLPDEKINITGDRDLLFQAIANVLDNAIKYTPEAGQVSVTMRQHGSQAVVEVIDSGVGIPEEKYDKVFERFYRVEASRGQQSGNGLGLSLVAAVMKLHDGKISLHAGKPGLQVRLLFSV
jgi:signal transduction histidine kinase